MTVSVTKEQRDQLVARLNRTEGRRSKPYVDTVGKVTIGVGFNLTDVGLYDDEIDFILNRRIERAADDASTLPGWDGLDDVRRTVLIDLVFNMGLATVQTFKNTLSYIKIKNFDAAAENLLKSKWAQQVGLRADKLAAILRYGNYLGVKQ